MARICLTLLLMLAAIPGCGGEGPVDGQSVLHRGLSSDPESLDPQRARSVSAADILRDTGEGLLAYSASGALIPGAAESWDVADDGLTYVFQIRADARWSNGDPVTAQHFVDGLRRLVDPAVAAFYANTISDITNAAAIISGAAPVDSLGAEALEQNTLQISLTRPVPYLLSLLTHPSTFPVHEIPTAATEGEADRLSNGAYTLVAWQPGSVLRLRRNGYYWNNEQTAIDAVHHHVITEETAELNRYRAGELHSTSTIPPENFNTIRDEYGEQMHIAPYLGIYYYGFNLTRPPFRDNPALRQALSMAIDRKVLVEKITGRGEVAAYSFVPPGTDNYAPPRLSYADLTQERRIAIARSLYHEAGYGDDKPAEIEVRYNTSATQQRIALAIQSMWRDALGFEATLVGEEFRVLLTNIADGQNTEAFRGSWIGDYNDATTFLNLLAGDNPANLSGYVNEEYDSLMERAGTQLNLDRRRLYLEEAERVLLSDHPVLPLYFYVSKHLVRPEVQGWEDNVLDYHYSQHLSLDAGP